MEISVNAEIQVFPPGSYNHLKANIYSYQMYREESYATDMTRFYNCGKSEVSKTEIYSGKFESTKPTSELHDHQLGGTLDCAANNDSGLQINIRQPGDESSVTLSEESSAAYQMEQESAD